ncbi:MAG: aminomethyltransferase family protein [Proteobacteria bacterium]|nr:aminomethyltransferase family protein [Pseudomonadota bacterium]
MTQELSRTSALADRHRALGSGLEDWNGMGTAWTYDSDPNIEHNAIREAAGLFDMSGLKKVQVRGKDAAAVIDHLISRDMSKINVGQSAYGSILNDAGRVCDDAIIYHLQNEHWLLVHGSGESMERLQESAAGKAVTIAFDDDLHDISLQGPLAVDFLNAHTPLDLPALRYFQQQQTTLFNHPCILSRTGYSGERGYEIFAATAVVGEIWDNIVKLGATQGIMPCSFTALDKVRIEAALLFYGYDMTAEHSPWEVGLGWTISSVGDYRGKAAAMKLREQKRFEMVGLVFEHSDALVGGESLIHANETVGTVNSPGWSQRMKQSLGLAHLRPDLTAVGTTLQVTGEEGFSCQATVAATPFYDPTKSRTHA